MKDPTNRLIHRTQTYWYSDGLAEIGFTTICLVLSAYFYGQATLAPESLLFRILDVGFLLILLVSGLVTRKLVGYMKIRLTYPRTGYVSYKQPSPAQWVASVALGIIISSASILLFYTRDNLDVYMPAISGILAGFVLMFFAYRSRVLRFLLLAILSILLGTGLSISGIGDMMGLSYYYGLMGLVLLFFGSFALRDYLMHTQPLEE
jgi:hypothetical protein